jgi:hypothetical protein
MLDVGERKTGTPLRPEQFGSTQEQATRSPDCLVPRPCGQHLGGWAEGHAAHRPRVACQDIQQPACLEGPDVHLERVHCTGRHHLWSTGITKGTLEVHREVHPRIAACQVPVCAMCAQNCRGCGGAAGAPCWFLFCCCCISCINTQCSPCLPACLPHLATRVHCQARKLDGGRGCQGPKISVPNQVKRPYSTIERG